MLKKNIIEWELAYNQFQAFRNNLRDPINEDCVSEYHTIIESLEAAGEQNLDEFRIDADKMEFLLVQAVSGEHIDPRIGVQYSNKKYCDREYFCGKADQLQKHLRSRSTSNFQQT